MKKIWIFNHYAIAPGASGGTRHYDLGKELCRKGNQVRIFAASFNHQAKQESIRYFSSQYVQKEIHNGVQYVWIKTIPYQKNDWRRICNILSYTFRAFMECRRTEEKPDIVIGSLMHPLAALLGYVVAKKKKCAFYFEERDLWPETLVHLGKFSRKNPIVWMLSQLEMFLYRKAERIIVLFDKAVDYVSNRGIDRGKVLYLPNGVDLSRYNYPHQEVPSELEELLNRLQNRLVAVYIGAHGVANNLDSILEAASLLQQDDEWKDKLMFLFIGDGTEKNRLIKKANEARLSNVIFGPAIPKEWVPIVLERTHIALVSMLKADIYKWGFSLNKLYDYLAASLPVVIQCHLETTLIDQEGIGIKVSTSKEMAEAIRWLARSDNERAKMGEKAREYVEKHHSWNELSNRLIDSWMSKERERECLK